MFLKTIFFAYIYFVCKILRYCWRTYNINQSNPTLPGLGPFKSIGTLRQSRNSPFTLQHSPLSIRHSTFTLHHSTFTRLSPFPTHFAHLTLHHSSFTTHLSPLITHLSFSLTLPHSHALSRS